MGVYQIGRGYEGEMRCQRTQSLKFVFLREETKNDTIIRRLYIRKKKCAALVDLLCCLSERLGGKQTSMKLTQ